MSNNTGLITAPGFSTDNKNPWMDNGGVDRDERTPWFIGGLEVHMGDITPDLGNTETWFHEPGFYGWPIDNPGGKNFSEEEAFIISGTNGKTHSAIYRTKASDTEPYSLFPSMRIINGFSINQQYDPYTSHSIWPNRIGMSFIDIKTGQQKLWALPPLNKDGSFYYDSGNRFNGSYYFNKDEKAAMYDWVLDGFWVRLTTAEKGGKNWSEYKLGKLILSYNVGGSSYWLSKDGSKWVEHFADTRWVVGRHRNRTEYGPQFDIAGGGSVGEPLDKWHLDVIDKNHGYEEIPKPPLPPLPIS